MRCEKKKKKIIGEEDGIAVCINHCVLYVWTFRPIAPCLKYLIGKENWKKAKTTENICAYHAWILWRWCDFGYLVRQLIFFSSHYQAFVVAHVIVGIQFKYTSELARLSDLLSILSFGCVFSWVRWISVDSMCICVAIHFCFSSYPLNALSKH